MPKAEKPRPPAGHRGGAVGVRPLLPDSLDFQACLQFQREAAGVYGMLSCLPQMLSSLLEDAEFHKRKSKANRKDGQFLVAAIEQEIAIWLSLSPPRPLEADWERVLGMLEELLEFAEEYAEFQEPLSPELVAPCRSRFRDWMSATEAVRNRQLKREQSPALAKR